MHSKDPTISDIKLDGLTMEQFRILDSLDKMVITCGRTAEPFAKEVESELFSHENWVFTEAFGNDVTETPFYKEYLRLKDRIHHLQPVTAGSFGDGEIHIEEVPEVYGKDVHYFQLVRSGELMHLDLFETFLTMDALTRAGANSITIYFPYIPYGRQDRLPDNARTSISARTLIDHLTISPKVSGIVTTDLHADQIQGFSNLKIENLQTKQFILAYILSTYDEREVLELLGPDVGSSKRTASSAKLLKLGYSLVDKTRPEPEHSFVHYLIGDIKDKHAIILDDLYSSFKSVDNAARSAREHGAVRVDAFAAHAVLNPDTEGREAMERIRQAQRDGIIKRAYVFNTIVKEPGFWEKNADVISVFPIEPVYARAMYIRQTGRSLRAFVASMENDIITATGLKGDAARQVIADNYLLNKIITKIRPQGS